MDTRKGLRSAALVAALVASGGGAAQAHDDLPPAIEAAGAPAPARAPGPWQVSLGLRSALFRSAGYDPFKTDDVFVQGGATATWALPTGRALSTAVGAIWETGSEGATARGADTSLSLRRLGGLVEERFAPRPWLYAFARLSPTWLHGEATLHDLSIPAPLGTTFDSLAVDGSVGAAARLTPRGSRVSFLAIVDAGYGWAPTQHLALVPELPASDRNKAGMTTLDDLAPRGVFYRLSVGVGF
jgi:hypothetical protein